MIRNIYIVDDNPRKRNTIMGYMKKLFPEAEIARFSCAMHFLHYLDREDCEAKDSPNETLIITDMQMPVSSTAEVEIECGYFVLEELQRKGAECPAIVVSSEPIDEGRAARTYDYYKGFVGYSSWRDITDDFKKVLSGFLNVSE